MVLWQMLRAWFWHVASQIDLKKDKLRLRKFCMFYATNKKTVTKI